MKERAPSRRIPFVILNHPFVPLLMDRRRLTAFLIAVSLATGGTAPRAFAKPPKNRKTMAHAQPAQATLPVTNATDTETGTAGTDGAPRDGGRERHGERLSAPTRATPPPPRAAAAAAARRPGSPEPVAETLPPRQGPAGPTRTPMQRRRRTVALAATALPRMAARVEAAPRPLPPARPPAAARFLWLPARRAAAGEATFRRMPVRRLAPAAPAVPRTTLRPGVPAPMARMFMSAASLPGETEATTRVLAGLATAARVRWPRVIPPGRRPVPATSPSTILLTGAAEGNVNGYGGAGGNGGAGRGARVRRRRGARRRGARSTTRAAASGRRPTGARAGRRRERATPAGREEWRRRRRVARAAGGAA